MFIDTRFNGSCREPAYCSQVNNVIKHLHTRAGLNLLIMFEPARRDKDEAGPKANPVERLSIESSSGAEDLQHDPEKKGVTSIPTEVAVDGSTEEVVGEAEEPPSAPYSAFTKAQKIAITLTVSFLAIISPLSGQIYLPALDPLSKDLGVSISLINLTITTFMVCQPRPSSKVPEKAVSSRQF